MEKLKPEKEQANVKTETLTANQFIDKVYQNGSFPADKRFRHYNDGGSFKYLDLSTVDYLCAYTKQFYPVIEADNKIVGISELEKNPYEENIYWLKFITIDKNKRDNGYASLLLEEVSKFAKNNNIIIQSSAYSESGLIKLKKKLNELADKYKVTFIDTDERI